MIDQANGNVGPHKDRSDQERIFTVARGCGGDKRRETGLIRAKTLACQIVPHKRAPTEPNAKVAKVFEGPKGTLSVIRAQSSKKLGPDPGLRLRSVTPQSKIHHRGRLNRVKVSDMTDGRAAAISVRYCHGAPLTWSGSVCRCV